MTIALWSFKKSVKPAMLGLGILATLFMVATILLSVSSYNALQDRNNYVYTDAQKIEVTVAGGPYTVPNGRFIHNAVPASIPTGEVVTLVVGEDIPSIGTKVELWSAPVREEEAWTAGLPAGFMMQPRYDQGTESTYSRTKFQVVEAAPSLQEEFAAIIGAVLILTAGSSYLMRMLAYTSRRKEGSLSYSRDEESALDYGLLTFPWLISAPLSAFLFYGYLSKGNADGEILGSYVALAIVLSIVLNTLGVSLLTAAPAAYFEKAVSDDSQSKAIKTQLESSKP